MTTDHGRATARRRMSLALRIATAVVFAAAAAAWLLPDRAGEGAGVAMVAALIAAPVARLTWLLLRWARFDRRYALLVAVLLVELAASLTIALIQR